MNSSFDHTFSNQETQIKKPLSVVNDSALMLQSQQELDQFLRDGLCGNDYFPVVDHQQHLRSNT